MTKKFINKPTLKEKVVYILLEEYSIGQDIVDELMEKYYDQVLAAVPGGDADQIADVIVEKLTHKGR